jgi:hypothetical protein
MIVADLDRANSRVATVERRNVRPLTIQGAVAKLNFRKSCVPKLRLRVVEAMLPTGRTFIYFPRFLSDRSLTV